MTDMSKEAMKLALEALEDLQRQYAIYPNSFWDWSKGRKAITALREALAEQSAQQQVAWVPYLSDRADGVSGHYAIARWNPRGYREVWNLRRHAWGAYSDDVLSLEEADTLLRLIEIPTRKVETPQPAQQQEPVVLKDLCAMPEVCPEHAHEFYTSPQAQRTWVGLTRAERFEIEKAMSKYYDYQHECKTVCLPEFARAIEANLKEKNA